MISCYKLGPALTNFILNAIEMQFECSSKFLVLKIDHISCCLDHISVEIAARCTFKRKWTIQAQYRLCVSTY